jgi:CheY-like chemotaxis protein
MQTVLLVEDSKVVRIAREHAVRKAGYHVVIAVDGMEALSIARVSLPDLILLDMMLPKLDGPSVLRALESDPLTAQIPVVVLTGLSQKNNGSQPLISAIRRVLESRVV